MPDAGCVTVPSWPRSLRDTVYPVALARRGHDSEAVPGVIDDWIDGAAIVHVGEPAVALVSTFTPPVPAPPPGVKFGSAFDGAPDAVAWPAGVCEAGGVVCCVSPPVASGIGMTGVATGALLAGAAGAPFVAPVLVSPTRVGLVACAGVAPPPAVGRGLVGLRTPGVLPGAGCSGAVVCVDGGGPVGWLGRAGWIALFPFPLLALINPPPSLLVKLHEQVSVVTAS